MAIGAKCAAPSFAVFWIPAVNLEGYPKDALTEFEDYFQQPDLSADFGSASRALRSAWAMHPNMINIAPEYD